MYRSDICCKGCAWKNLLANNWSGNFSAPDVIKWKQFPRYWPFLRGIYLSPVNSLQKGQSRSALIFSLIYSWINGWVSNREAGDLRRHRIHYDVTVIICLKTWRFINIRRYSSRVRLYRLIGCWYFQYILTDRTSSFGVTDELLISMLHRGSPLQFAISGEHHNGFVEKKYPVCIVIVLH